MQSLQSVTTVELWKICGERTLPQWEIWIPAKFLLNCLQLSKYINFGFIFGRINLLMLVIARWKLSALEGTFLHRFYRVTHIGGTDFCLKWKNASYQNVIWIREMFLFQAGWQHFSFHSSQTGRHMQQWRPPPLLPGLLKPSTAQVQLFVSVRVWMRPSVFLVNSNAQLVRLDIFLKLLIYSALF